MKRFDRVLMVDWSARSKPSPKRETKDAIFIADVSDAGCSITYCRTRHDATLLIGARFEDVLNSGQTVLAGFDFPFGYPRGFAKALTRKSSALAVWSWLFEAVEDGSRNENNRLDVADRINAKFKEVGPFWSHPVSAQPKYVPFRKPPHQGFPFQERREVEQIATGASSCFQLFGNGAVASQSLLGLPRLEALRRRFSGKIAVRPFETRDAPIVLAEIYPARLDRLIRSHLKPNETLDAAQVRVLATAFFHLPDFALEAMLHEGDPEEGWIAGLGHEDALTQAFRKTL